MFKKLPKVVSRKNRASFQPKDYRLVFFGTPEFSLPALYALRRSGYTLSFVVTQPDRPARRGQKTLQSPVKIAAQKFSLKVFQPLTLRSSEVEAVLRETAPHVMVVVAFGMFIPSRILSLPRYGVINVHPSLLPEFRGASPIQASILHGRKKTGATIMLLDQGLDSGPVLAQKSIEIRMTDTAGSLHDRLAVLGADLLVETLPKYLSSKLRPKPQDHSQATFTRKVSKEQGRIDWTRSAKSIDRHIRAFTPWPGAYTLWEENTGGKKKSQRLKILEAKPLSHHIWRKRDIGRILLRSTGKIVVLCGKGSLELKRVHLENKKPLAIRTFIQGARNFIGGRLL